MIPAALRERLRSGRARVVAAIVVAALGALVVVLAVAGSADGVKVTSRFVAGTPEAGEPVSLDTPLPPPPPTPAPAVLLSHGYGGDKSGLAGKARTRAADGFVVLTDSARGF